MSDSENGIADFAANHEYWAGVREKKHAAEAEQEFNDYVTAIPLPHQRSAQAAPQQPRRQPENATPAAAAAMGVSPIQQNQAPEPPSVADMTGYLTDLIDAHQKFKRPVPKELLDSAYSYMQNSRDNGYHDALIQMSKGNPKGAEDAFNRSGLGRIAITDFKPTKTNINGIEHDSYLATYHHLDENGQPFGQPVKADVTKELFSQLDLEKRFKLATEGMKANSALVRAEAVADKPKSSSITVSQQRINSEIEAARKYIVGLSPEEIKRRTQSYTATGRDNPDYDPMLAEKYRLSNRRKYGADDTYPLDPALAETPARAVQHDDIQGKFSADPAMKGHRLGSRTPKGVEVFDANGKLIGHYN